MAGVEPVGAVSVDTPGGAVPLRVMAEQFAERFAGEDPREVRRQLAESHAASIAHHEATAAVDPFSPLNRLPKRFRKATFDNYEPETDSQRTALDTVRRWVDFTLKGKPAMLALIGSTGAGKSHLLYAAAHALVDAGQHFYARPWYQLADELRYGGRSAYLPPATGQPLEPREVREQLWEATVVLIDEVRLTAGTAFDDTELAKYACHAYDAMLSVFVTSNVKPLADVMGPAAASRFTQVEIVGPDRRQTR